MPSGTSSSLKDEFELFKVFNVFDLSIVFYVFNESEVFNVFELIIESDEFDNFD